MILTDYYKGEKLTEAKSRFDITTSTNTYDLFENLLINKQKFNIGGLSFNLVKSFGKQKKDTDYAITKGSFNITKLMQPDPSKNFAFGDINNTKDACIMIINPNYKDIGIVTIEIFIARGCKNSKHNIFNMLENGELSNEIESLRKQAVTKNVTQNNV